MKQAIYFTPPVMALAVYGLLGLAGDFGAIHWAVWFFIALLFVSGLLLWREKWWGSLGGILVGMVLIDMSTQYTGQVIEIEGPLGILFCIYYGLCGLMVRKKESARRFAQESQGEPYLKVDLMKLRLLLVFFISFYCLFMQGFAFPSLSPFWELALRILAAFSLQMFFCRTKWPAVIKLLPCMATSAFVLWRLYLYLTAWSHRNFIFFTSDSLSLAIPCCVTAILFHIYQKRRYRHE